MFADILQIGRRVLELEGTTFSEGKANEWNSFFYEERKDNEFEVSIRLKSVSDALRVTAADKFFVFSAHSKHGWNCRWEPGHADFVRKTINKLRKFTILSDLADI